MGIYCQKLTSSLVNRLLRYPHEGPCVGPCSGIMPRALWWPKVWGLFLLSKVPLFRQVASDRAARGSPATERFAERDFFVDNLLVRIHCIIVLIRWTGLAPCKFEFPSPGSLPISSRQLSQFNSRKKYTMVRLWCESVGENFNTVLPRCPGPEQAMEVLGGVRSRGLRMHLQTIVYMECILVPSKRIRWIHYAEFEAQPPILERYGDCWSLSAIARLTMWVLTVLTHARAGCFPVQKMMLSLCLDRNNSV